MITALIGLAVCIYFKQWLFVFVIVAVSVPDIAARIMTNGAVGSKDYSVIAAILSTVLYAIFLIGSLVYFMKDGNRRSD